MFLATTADQRYWDKSKDVLFLGEWCKVHSQRHVWEKLNHQVVPYQWDDRERFAKDFEYLDALNEKYLSLVAEQMDQLHGETYPVRYWRIILGVWLRNFIDATYDRYLTLKEATDKFNITGTWVCLESPYPNRTRPSYAWDHYNLYLISKMIVIMGTIPYEVRNFKPDTPVTVTSKKNRFQRIIDACLYHVRKGPELFIRQGFAALFSRYWPRLAQKITSDIVFVGSMYLPLWHQIKLQLSLRQLPYLYHGDKIQWEEIKIDHGMREKIRFPSPQTEFEKILNELIPSEILHFYVEDYKKMKEVSLSLGPKNPKVIVTARSMHYREPYEFWIAHNVVENNTKMVFAQHGGGLGSMRLGSIENHYVRTYDHYFTWGSPLEFQKHVDKMPSFRLYCLKEQLSSINKDGQILLMATTMPRYKVFVESGVAGKHMLDWIDFQRRFLKRISPQVKEILTWRYFNQMWEESDMLQEEFPDLRMQKGFKKELGKKSDFISEVLKSRLTIHTANETTYLETLAANYPTLLYWPGDCYQVKDSVRPYFQALEKAGILFLDPEKAAEKLNRIYTDPLRWWQSEEVQKARALFCENLAYVRDDYIEVWKERLTTIIKDAEKVGRAQVMPVHKGGWHGGN